MLRSDAKPPIPAMRRASMAFASGLILATAPTQAMTFTVTTSADSGAGSLRQAVLDANAASATDANGYGSEFSPVFDVLFEDDFD